MYLNYNESSTATFNTNEVFNAEAVDFWLYHLRHIELEATKHASRKYDPSSMDSFKPLDLTQLSSSDIEDMG